MVSIRAPREGSDDFWVWQSCQFLSFNPRPREGSDFASWRSRGAGDSVSIRAPAKGAI